MIQVKGTRMVGQFLPYHTSGFTDPEIPNSRSPDSRFGRETGKGIPDSRLGRNRESGTPVSRFGRDRESGSRVAANREIGDTPLCEYSSRDPGLNVALSP